VSLPHLKRLIEYGTAQPALFSIDEDQYYQKIDDLCIQLPKELLTYLKRVANDPKLRSNISKFTVLDDYFSFYKNNFSNYKEIRENCTRKLNEPFRSWRDQQIEATNHELQSHFGDRIIHAPVCFELCLGCTVGCWFCAVSAPKMDGILSYTSQNQSWWKSILKAVKSVIGEGGKHGFCYWATDPFDNPDYEKFCLDFFDEFGKFPTTTTALALKNPKRTKQLLDLSAQHKCQVNRFSVLTLKNLEKLYNHFTPEELLYVEIIPQNKQSSIPKSIAGRARDRHLKKSISGDNPFRIPKTSSCVSGFLLNMVEKSVKLISPCNASDKHPLGYKIHASGVFTNADDLQQSMNTMIKR